MTIECPADQVLSRYAIGDLDDASSDEIERHLENCSACADSVARFDSTEDSLMRHLPLAAAEADAPGEKPGWLERLRNGPPEQQASAAVPSAAPENRPAQFSAYDLLGVLGRGGMGVVYRARHRQLNRVVALKVLHPRLTATPEARRRFEREIQILGGLHHPGIVMATDANRIDGAAYLVMELIDGIDLARMVRRGGPLTIAEACEIGRQMAEALAVAHQAGTIHRDIKPSNVMVDRHGRVKLLDFGLAHFAAISTESLETSLGRLLGTLDYMAPEQAEAERPVDPRTDLYSLGATLFYLLTGRPPHGDHSRGSLLQQLRSLAVGDPPRLSSLRADVPPEIDEFVARLLSRDREKRPDSALGVAAALSAWAGGDLAARVAEVRAGDVGDSASDDGELANRSLSELLQGEPVARPVDTPTTVTPPSVARQKGRWSTHRLAWLMGTAAILGGLLYGVTILLRTPEGTLKIESEADNVAVELVDERDQPKVLQIHVGENESTLRAGKYRVRFSGKHDGISLDQDEFTLRRGEKIVARVTRTPDSVKQPISENSPTNRIEKLYQGKTESEWQRVFIAETAPVAKVKAAEALLAMSSELPPPAAVNRWLDLGSDIVRAGYVADPIYFALTGGTNNLRDWRWPIDRRELFSSLAPFLSEADESLLSRIPSQPVVAGLSKAMRDGPDFRAALAASVLRGTAFRNAVEKEGASRPVLDELDLPLTGKDWSAVCLLVRSRYLKNASTDQAATIVANLERLAHLLKQAPPSRISGLLVDDLLSVLGQDGMPRSGRTRLLAAGLILDRIVRTQAAPPNASWLTRHGSDPRGLTEAQEISQTRKEANFFLDRWMVVVNNYLEKHRAPPYTAADREISYSLLKVLRLSQDEDYWPVVKTAPPLSDLLSDQLRAYFTDDVKATTDKSVEDLLPVEPATLLMEIVSINGQIPDFVRTGHPKVAAVVEKMKKFESIVRAGKTSSQQLQAESGNPFSELLVQDPYEVVKLAVEPRPPAALPQEAWNPQSVLNATSINADAVWNNYGRTYPIDPLLLLALVADMTGTSPAQDERIATLITNDLPPAALGVYGSQLPVRKLLSSSLTTATVARGLLKKMAKNAKGPVLINVIRYLDPALAPPKP